MTDAPVRLSSRLSALKDGHACDSDLKTCRENWPDHPASWCAGCVVLALIAACEALEQERDHERDDRIKTYDNGVQLRKYLEAAEARCAALEQQLADRTGDGDGPRKAFCDGYGRAITEVRAYDASKEKG